MTPAVMHDPQEMTRRAQELTEALSYPVAPGFEVFVSKARLGTPDEHEWTYIRKDGRRFPVLLSVTALRDGEGNLTGFLGIGSDITERKRAEETNILLASIVESSDDAIIGKTLDGIVTSWNHGAERIYLYAAAEVVGRSISLLTPPDKLEELSEILNKIKQGQRVEHLETLRVRKDGQLTNISLTISPIKGADGRVIGVSTISRDITNQKRAETELRKLSRAVQASPATVVITDAQANIEYVNPKFTEITGYSFIEAIGKNPRILKSGEKPPEEYKELWDTITSGREWRGIFHNKKKNGELYWESASISPVKDKRGFITHYIAVKEDITSMKEAQDELAKLSLVASKTDNMVIISDGNGRIEWVNDGFTRITGYQLDEVMGKTPGSFLQGPLTDPYTRERMRDAVLQRKSFTEEVVNYHKDGRYYWVSMVVTPIFDEKGEVTKFISIESDITERKQAEAEIQEAKAAADAASRAKSDFLASMSHEIRTPMNAIVGMADLLWESDLTVEQRRYVEIFRTAGENLLNLINNILDLSKVEAGHLTLEATDFNLGDLIEKLCETMALRAHNKNIELVCRVMPDVPQDLIGDPLRLQQILINLMGNAIKFTERGEILLEVRKVEDSVAIEGNGRSCLVHFSVKDTGIGIPSDKLGQIFESFTQFDSSVTRKYGGTGLGLTISRQLVELMGGRLTVESEIGSGSTFSFSIRFELQRSVHERRVTMNMQGLKALVVDDNATNRLILNETLTRWGIQVTEAKSGEAALQEVEAGTPFDFVILDKRMPDMDGFEVATTMREGSSLTDATILMLTSESRADDVRRAKELCISRYLVKPVKPVELLRAIQSLVLRNVSHREITAPTVASPERPADQRPLSILLVEDSEDNRLLIQAYQKKTSLSDRDCRGRTGGCGKG